MIRKKIIVLTCIIVMSALFVSCNAQPNKPYGRMGGRDRPFVMDYQNKFFGDNTVFNQDIAIASLMVISRQAYGQGRQVMEDMGFENFQVREIGNIDNDRKWTAMAHQVVERNGEERVIILVAIPGIYGMEGWFSNFDIGADTPEYFELTNSRHPEWVNRCNHKGFDVTANRIITEIKRYMRTIQSEAQPVLWVTGFSRGGSIASIVGAYFENDPSVITYIYPIAPPNVTTMAAARDYQTIFNIVNEDDLIDFLPPAKWGFTRFGRDISISISDYGQEVFFRLTGQSYTIREGHRYIMDSVIREIGISSREELYVFDYNAFFVSETSHRYEAEAEKHRLERALRREHRQFVKFNIYDVRENGGYKVVRYQTPAFIFQLFPVMIYAQQTGTNSPLPNLDAWTTEMTEAFIDAFDLGHAHSPAAYYLIITELLAQALE